MNVVLSILIPTFNRSRYLGSLLANLEVQLSDPNCSEAIEVLISDNASEDDTAQVLSTYKKRNPSWIVKKTSENIGPESNMLSLLEASCGKYRWILGDDDLPIPHLIDHVLDILRNNSPSLIYLPSEWAPDVTQINTTPISGLQYHYCSPLECARQLNIWITFISSWIFNAEMLFSGLGSIESISRCLGSSFLPLGWILPLLLHPNSSILIVKNISILATSGNSGGYSVIHAFMVNYPLIVFSHARNQPKIRHALLGMPLSSYMPSLILSARFGVSSFQASNITKVFFQSVRLLWRYPSYWLLCVPALVLPRPVYALLSRSKAISRRIAGRFND